MSGMTVALLNIKSRHGQTANKGQWSEWRQGKSRPPPVQDRSNETVTNYQINTKEIIMETNKNRINTWDRIMMAIAFAEVGEHDSARELLKKKQNEQRPEARSRKYDQRPEIRA